MVFNAGAGAGKTYALIESLKYIITNKSKQLTHHNQQVICITYTNVATNEIKDRLGNTSLIKVSTIHERLWGLIKAYQKQLVLIHKDKLEIEISQIESELETDIKFQAYNGIEDKEDFLSLMLENKETYYQVRGKPHTRQLKGLTQGLNLKKRR
ncbi:UvrD-helicase domain-containing protein, partial [Candidatus Gracilibacteria bacterium]|nr:UvrD-helicase domain-containing protein [Candidatus Gracilibacteria bacterium]